MFCLVVGILAVLVTGLQLVYLVFMDVVLQRRPGGERNGPEVPVSVIICARNELLHLKHRLPALLEQDYESYEVILVDDGSTDGTADFIQKLQSRFPKLRYLRVEGEEKSYPGKKGALAIGVNEAVADVLLLTDADCVPASPYWIEKMTQALSKEKEIVVGYGPYEGAPGFLNGFIRGETLLTFLNIKAFHRLGIHYMAVGRNLCVRKEAFIRAAQHRLWRKTLSGDDDMLMRICAHSGNVAVVADPETFMFSPASPDWKSYIRQKQRHLSTGKYYRPSIQLLLGFVNGSQALCWLLLPFLLYCTISGAELIHFLALGLLLIRLLFLTGMFSKQARKHQGFFAPLFPVAFDAAYALYPLFFAPYIFWKNKDQWN